MNSRLASLQRYPFERLAELIKDITPPANKSPIKMSMGEPQHAAPPFVLEALTKNLKGLSNYPITKGAPALREAIARWATRRFKLDKIKLDPERHVLPVAGTREALFSIAQAVVDRKAHADQPVVIAPNPFYQIYEGAALLAGARCFFLKTIEENNYRMDFARVPADVWPQVQLVYICSPGNPTGKVMDRQELVHLIELANKHNFLIASDECYSEIYFDEAKPPLGLLQVANELGHGGLPPLPGVPFAVQSAQTCRGCAPASSPATARSSPSISNTAPTTVAPCRRRRRRPASPPGTTRRTWPKTGRCTARNSTPCSKSSRRCWT